MHLKILIQSKGFSEAPAISRIDYVKICESMEKKRLTSVNHELLAPPQMQGGIEMCNQMGEIKVSE